MKVTRLNNAEFVRVSGPDAMEFLQGQLTCDMKKLSTSISLTGAICNLKGRVIANFQIALDGKDTNLSENDISRRNTITNLLKDWGLVEIVGELGEMAPLSQIKVLSFSEKDSWQLEAKYNIGKKTT